MIRFGESCLYSMRGRCFNTAAEPHGRSCPHVGEQFCCAWYNGAIPRVSCTEVVTTIKERKGEK